jgi:hypothetical protein
MLREKTNFLYFFLSALENFQAIPAGGAEHS